ncbi:unnamed protein product [Phytomonas sp. EM1]|nr:unnamed protein product [Phytomonas sp. EM1]|eukprot:CCW60196.1 unnamed protein product [Phytomonas sp. isolate EM1]
MLKPSLVVRSLKFRTSIKYPSLVSYNKLPWELINHETPALHMYLAPHYQQLLTLASLVQVPHLAAKSHPVLGEHQRLQMLPGMVYFLPHDTIPEGFTPHDVADPTAMQYYGTLTHTIASILRVRLLTSDDLRLLCLAITFEDSLLDVASSSTLELVGAGGKSIFTFYHYFRPNRPATELTRPLEKYYQHRPQLTMLGSFADGTSWEPRLATPEHTRKLTPPVPYRPPRSYLMGLAERLAVVPGSCFGRRSLMWGHWF